jgi:hypothetical protein
MMERLLEERIRALPLRSREMFRVMALLERFVT